MKIHSKTRFAITRTYLLLFLLIAAQILYTAYMFAFHKDGLHSDEVFSYGLSNSYYQPYLGCSGDADLIGTISFNVDPETGAYVMDRSDLNLINCYTWTEGSAFSDYLTVQPGERFAYGSVIYNQRLDLHPPLYYILLHTVCSLFPDQFSRWYAFSLNLLFLIGTQIFLFLTARRISRSDSAALLACLLYGAGNGALSTFLFLRQYSLQTMLCMAFTYFAVSAYYQWQDSRKIAAPAFFCAVGAALLAFFTHYYSIVYIGVFTALYCLCLLCQKRVKQMFAFGGSLLTALLVFCALWPVFFEQTFTYDTKHLDLFSPWVQTKMLLRYFCRYCLGFSIPVLQTAFWKITLPLAAFLLLAFGALLIPFRDEPWCQKIFSWLKRLPGRLVRAVRTADYAVLPILGAALSLYVVIALITNVPWMGDFVIRYLLLTFPPLCLTAVVVVYKLLKRIPRVQKAAPALLAACVAAALISVNLTTDSPFLMPHYGEPTDVSALTEDKNVVVIVDDLSRVFNIVHCITPYVTETRHTYITSKEVLAYGADDIRSLEEPIDYVLIVASCLKPDEANQAAADALLAEAGQSMDPLTQTLSFLGVTGDLSEDEYTVLDSLLEESEDSSTETGKVYLPDEAASLASQDGQSAEVRVEAADCSAVIQTFNGGCRYKILCGLNIQGALCYVLELE
ncbi:MAG: glycosyltransferase family 39 protein [Muribaculum sp.]|nr:glycosyltransferase family 39 protein [Muribaculum sp.]